MELVLSGCSVTHVPKDGKKKKPELKIVHQGADPLVLALQSQEQAEEWLKVPGRSLLSFACSSCPSLQALSVTPVDPPTVAKRPGFLCPPTLQNTIVFSSSGQKVSSVGAA